MRFDNMKINEIWAAEMLPKRLQNGHKGTFGKVYILAGSTGLTGAPVFAADAAVRCGTGLVYLGVPKDIYQIVAVRCAEAMPSPLSCDAEGRTALSAAEAILEKTKGMQAVLVGPGMGRYEDGETLLGILMARIEQPLILDADALFMLGRHMEYLQDRSARGLVTILTPHEGEFGYLLGGKIDWGNSEEEKEKRRMQLAAAFTDVYGCTLVLKGPGTLVTIPAAYPGDEILVMKNTTGNGGMAKGGSGDVLSGMILSFLGQGMQPSDAAALAVYMHGRAGDLAARDLTEYAMRPTDMINYLPKVFSELCGRIQ